MSTTVSNTETATPARPLPRGSRHRRRPASFDDACLAAVCRSARTLFDVSGAEISVRGADGRLQVTRDGGTAGTSDGAGRTCGLVAEAPILSEDGTAIGTLGLFDAPPRRLAPSQADRLRSLAMVAGAHLSLMRARAAREPDPPRTEAFRYRALAHALPQMIWVMRASDGEALYVNRRFEDYHGPIGRSAAARLACHHPDDEARLAEAWTSARMGRTIEMEGRLRRHDGAYRWHKLVMIPVRSGDRVVEWIGTALDIDEIVRAHEKLEDATGLLRLAQTAAGAGVWEWAVDSQTVRLSLASARMHGIALEPEANGTDGAIDVSLQRWKQTMHPRDFRSLEAAAGIALRDGGSFTAEFRVMPPTQDGAQECRWLQTFGQLLRDAKTGRPDRLVGLSLDVTERRRSQSRIEHMALHDGLTGLPNRVQFKDNLCAALKGESRFALLLCDLDGFKGVNDTLGHGAGDALLQAIAGRLQSEVQSPDTVARLGGDEFAILLVRVGGPETAGLVARRLIEAVSRPVGLDGYAARVGMSVGIAIAGEASFGIDEMMREADAALYRAKASGRNVHCFAPARF